MRSPGERDAPSSGPPARALGIRTPLSLLFVALVQGCTTSTGGNCEGQAYYIHHFTLSAEEYAQWSRGIPPADFASSSASPTPTTGDTTGATGTGSTGDTTTTTTTGPALMLTDAEICVMACAYHDLEQPDALASCSIGAPEMSGSVQLECRYPASCGGRHHACVQPCAAATDPDAAGWLARAAHDEAASVHAFLALHRELARHGAPRDLLAAVLLAAADETRHAAALAALARAHGGPHLAPTLTPIAPRDLLAIAVENAVAGCVHETWAGLCAAHQARHARDPAVRAAYAAIAGDEARHADLAWALAAWLDDQLTPAARSLVAAARRAAVARLHAELSVATADPARADADRTLGLPDPATARFLLAGLDAALWSQAA